VEGDDKEESMPERKKGVKETRERESEEGWD
jgi:hypothetical protein